MKDAAKSRLDAMLVEKGLVSGRDRAKALIMAGQVYVDGQKAVKPGEEVSGESELIVREDLPYVSRGGLKLEKAMRVFQVDINGAVCMDIGASTGGFTDCMLQNGAKKVYAVDVGYGQLAWKLRINEQVVVMERTNIRSLTPESLDEELDFASIDVSFISLKLVLPVAYSLLRDKGKVVCLVKPQFEAGRGKVGKKGVVREISTHMEVVESITRFAPEIGFCPLGLSYSPVKGPEGNIEYLLYLEKSSGQCAVGDAEIRGVVESSHEKL